MKSLYCHSYNVTGILPRAFFGNKNLKRVEFKGEFVALDIGDEAFLGCENLKVVEFPDASNLTTLNIGKFAFKDCTGLESLGNLGSITRACSHKKSIKN